MGDRVAFIGGKTVGRDHFPFPVVDATPLGRFGNHADFPIDFDIATALYMWAVVKRWSFDIEIYYTLSIEDPDNPGSFIFPVASDRPGATAQFTFAVPLGPDQGPPTREADLVLYQNDPTFLVPNLIEWNIGETESEVQSGNPLWNIEDYSDANVDPGTGFGIFLQFPLNPYWHADTSKIVFAVRLNVGADIELADSESLDDSNRLLNDNGNLINSAGDGFSEVSYGMRCTDLVPNPPTSANRVRFDDVQSTIQAIEFWTYATKAGLPVWDASTGAMLNTPD